MSPVAHAGYEEGYLRDAPRDLGRHGAWPWPGGQGHPDPRAGGLPGCDPQSRCAPWCAEALRRGYASAVGIPLLSGSEVLGALAILAAEPDAFDENEVQLLRELADDLSYGIVALRHAGRVPGGGGGPEAGERRA